MNLRCLKLNGRSQNQKATFIQHSREGKCIRTENIVCRGLGWRDKFSKRCKRKFGGGMTELKLSKLKSIY